MKIGKLILIATFLLSLAVTAGSCGLFGESEADRLRKELEELKKEKEGGEKPAKTIKQVKITSGYLSLRDAPDTSEGKLIARIPNGAEVELGTCKDESIEISGREGRWCEASYDGKSGWLFDAWLVAPSKKEPTGAKETLWDFRQKEGEAKTTSSEQSKKVLTYLFGDGWDDQLTITSEVKGSFTKPKADQTLYYVGGCEEGQGFRDTSNCSHSASWNAGWMAIYEGETPVMKVEGALGYAIGKLTDVNGDGINEIVSLNGFTNQGSTEKSIRFGEITGGKYKKVLLKGVQGSEDNFYPGYSDGCASGFPEAQIKKAAVVSYSPTSGGKMPMFSEEFFQSACESADWKKISKKQFAN